MTASPRKPLMVNLIWAAMLALPLLYVTVWVVLPCSMYRYGVPAFSSWNTIAPAFAPLDWYCDSKVPGGQSVKAWRNRLLWCSLAARSREPPVD